MFGTIREQIDTVFRRDPAARSVVEISSVLPGLPCCSVASHIAHRIYRARLVHPSA